MNYEVSRQASLDLRRIWRYTLEMWSLQQADEYIQMLLRNFEQIGHNPLLGKDCAYLIPNYRVLKAGSHMIYYQIKSAGEKVIIIRLLHQSVDVGKWLTAK